MIVLDCFSCNHEWNGPLYYVTQSGLYIDFTTHFEWIGYVDSFRQQLIHFHYDFIVDDPIIESGCTCSKCESTFQINHLNF